MKKFVICLLIFIAAAMLGVLLIRNYAVKNVYPKKYSEYVDKYSKEYELDKSFVYAVIKAESGFNKDALSRAEAYGLMQLTYETYEWLNYLLGNKEELSPEDLYEPDTNIKFGCYLLSLNIRDFGDKKTALAAYNAGRARVEGWLSDKKYSSDGKTLDKIPYEETESYVSKVLKYEKNYNKLYKEK